MLQPTRQDRVILRVVVAWQVCRELQAEAVDSVAGPVPHAARRLTTQLYGLPAAGHSGGGARPIALALRPITDNTRNTEYSEYAEYS